MTDSRSIDYTKWDHIEISDDEEKFHPNLDKGLNMKVLREQRRKKEESEKAELQRLKALGSDGDIDQITRLEKKCEMHQENLCIPSKEKTVFSSGESKSPLVPVPKNEVIEDDNACLLEEYMSTNEDTLAEFCVIEQNEELEKFLYANPVILHEYGSTASLILVKRILAHDRPSALQACKNYLMLRNIMDIAESLNSTRDCRPVVKKFFVCFKEEGGDKAHSLEKESNKFLDNIQSLIDADAFTKGLKYGPERAV